MRSPARAPSSPKASLSQLPIGRPSGRARTHSSTRAEVGNAVSGGAREFAGARANLRGDCPAQPFGCARGAQHAAVRESQPPLGQRAQGGAARRSAPGDAGPRARSCSRARASPRLLGPWSRSGCPRRRCGWPSPSHAEGGPRMSSNFFRPYRRPQRTWSGGSSSQSAGTWKQEEAAPKAPHARVRPATFRGAKSRARGRARGRRPRSGSCHLPL